MPVLKCSNTNCKINISVSHIPGGNPAVKMEPDKWSISPYSCPNCEKLFCDRCVKTSGGITSFIKGTKCPICGASVTKLKKITINGEDYHF